MSEEPMPLTPAERRVVDFVRSSRTRKLLQQLIDQHLDGLEDSKASMISDPVLNNLEDFMAVFGEVGMDQQQLHDLKEVLEDVERGL